MPRLFLTHKLTHKTADNGGHRRTEWTAVEHESGGLSAS